MSITGTGGDLAEAVLRSIAPSGSQITRALAILINAEKTRSQRSAVILALGLKLVWHCDPWITS